jgi:streptogramin lyase
VPDDIVTLGGPERRTQFHRVSAWAGRPRVAGPALAVALLIALAVTAGPPAGKPGHRSEHRRPVTSPPVYQVGLAVRIPVKRVVDIAGFGGDLWAIRSGARYQLVKIEARDGTVLLRVGLGRYYQAVGDVAGMVWLTTPFGRAGGQLERIDPATGRVIMTAHLPAGTCDAALAVSSGRLVAQCRVGSPGTAFFLLNPRNGAVEWRSARLSDLTGLFVALPGGVWYTTPSGIKGIIGFGAHSQAITVFNPPGINLATAQVLTSGDGYVWALDSDESVVKISPATGNVLWVYGVGGYQPSYFRAVKGLAVGGSSLWLVGGRPVGSVLRVRAADGQPLGLVPSTDIGSCGQPCGLIYDIHGAVWVPTANWLIKIFPLALPSASTVISVFHAARRPHARP